MSLRLATPDVVGHAYAGISPAGAAIFFTSHDATPLDAAPGLDLYAERITGTERIAGTADMSATADVIRYRGASSDGSVVAYFIEDAVPGPTITVTPYLRTPDLRRPLIPGGSASGPTGAVLAVSPDGRRRLFSTEAPLVPADTDSASDVYVDDDASGLHLMTPNTPGPLGVETVCGHSEDLGRVVFRTGAAVVAGDTNGVEDLYESSVSGTIVRRTALPLGAFPGAFCRATSTDLGAIVFSTGGRLVPEDIDSDEDVYLQSAAGLTRIARNPDGFEDVSVSQDGSIVTFETKSGYADSNDSWDAYQWRDGSLRRVPSTIVSADHRSTVTATDRRLSVADADEALDLYLLRDGRPAELLTRGMTGERIFTVHGISPDGTRLLFSTRGRITADDQDGGIDIYLGGDGVRLLSGAGNDHAIYRGASTDLGTVAFSTSSPLTSNDVDQAEDIYRATFTPPPPALPPSAPLAPAPAPVATAPGSATGRDTPPTARPKVTTSRRVSVATLARRGLRLSVTTSARARIEARLRVTAAVRRRLGLKSSILGTARSAPRTGRRTIVIKPSKATRARLARQRRTITATLEVRAVGGAGTRPGVTRRSVRITTR